MCSDSLLLPVGVEETTRYSSYVHKEACADLCCKNTEVRLQGNRKYSDKNCASMVPTSRKLMGRRKKS